MIPQYSSSASQEQTQSLSLKEAQKMFNELLNDKCTEDIDYDNVCLISGKALGTNTVSLPCGHKFDYLSLLSEQLAFQNKYIGMSRKCPYCRNTYVGNIPYRPDLSTKKKKNINFPVNSCFEKHACCYEESGQSCTINGTVPVGSCFACWRHYKRALKTQESIAKQQQEVVKCKAVLKSGKSKGNICGSTVKDENSDYCRRHRKPINADNLT